MTHRFNSLPRRLAPTLLAAVLALSAGLALAETTVVTATGACSRWRPAQTHTKGTPGAASAGPWRQAARGRPRR